jgi:hypothetical protein
MEDDQDHKPGSAAARPAAGPPLVTTTAWRWRPRPAFAAGGLLLVTAAALGNPAAERLALFSALSALVLLAFSFVSRPARRITLSASGIAVEAPHGRVDYPARDLRASTLDNGARVVEAGDGPLLVGGAEARRFPGALVLREADLAAIWERVRGAERGD